MLLTPAALVKVLEAEPHTTAPAGELNHVFLHVCSFSSSLLLTFHTRHSAPPCPPHTRTMQVLLLSARDALLSRLILSGRSDPANTQRFCRVAFGAYNPKPRGKQPPPQAPDALPGSGGRAVEELRAAAAGLLEGSGVPELEERVLGFLCEAAAGVKLMATLDDTGRLLAEVRGCV